MSWALESVVNEMAAELKQAGIEVNQKAMVMVTRDVAVRLTYHQDTAHYRKQFRDEIARVKEQKAAKIRARQISLL